MKAGNGVPWVLGALACVAVACEGGGSAARTPEQKVAAAKTPVEKCTALSDVLCAREHECLKTAPTSPCMFSLTDAGLCARVEMVDAGVSACAKDIGALSCESLFPARDLDLPTSCGGILTFAKTAAEKQCEDLITATCERLVECVSKPATAAEGAALVADCSDVLIAEAECSEVKGVSASYAACVQQTKTLACTALFPNGELADLPECTAVLSPDGGGGSTSPPTTPPKTTGGLGN